MITKNKIKILLKVLWRKQLFNNQEFDGFAYLA